MRKRRSVAMNRRPSRNSRPEGPAGACWSLAGGEARHHPGHGGEPGRAEREHHPGVAQGDDDAAEGRQEHAGSLPEHGVEGDRAHHVRAPDEAREEGHPSREVEADDEGDRPRDGEDVPHRHRLARVQGGEEGEEARGRERRRDEHRAPVHPVGDDPARERRDDGGDRGRRAEEPELEGRSAQLVDEPPLPHDEELERPHRGGGPEPVAPEARPAERRETRGEPRPEPPPPPHGAPADGSTPPGGRSRL